MTTGENCQITVISNIELTSGHVLSLVFKNANIIVRLVYKDMNMEPMVVQSHTEETLMGDSVFIMGSHGRPGLIIRSTCPSIIS